MTARTIPLAAAALAALGGALLAGEALAQPPGGRPPPVPGPPPPLAVPVARPPIAPADYTNAIGMAFMRIKAGTMIAGAYEPCVVMPPDPNPPPPAPRPAPAPASAAPDLTPLPPVVPIRFTCPTTYGNERGGWTPEQFEQADEMIRQATIPGFVVTLKKPYLMGRYEVTQGEWKKVMGSNPSIFQGSKVTDDPDRHPVENVTWADAQAFVKKLNQMEHTTAYRLPTEMEWEWAARAGSFRAPSIAGQPGEAAMAYAAMAGPTAPVGTKAPNAFGLYDVIGNVWEWVADVYNDKVVPDPPLANGKPPPATGQAHVLKGGSYMSHVGALGSAIHAGGPGDPFTNGFRIVKDIQ
jgi:formylglycine-generating enzyme required for sulfatase activity